MYFYTNRSVVKKYFFYEQMCDIIFLVYFMFKKIYIEITNMCNLNCDFCFGNNRDNMIILINYIFM